MMFHFETKIIVFFRSFIDNLRMNEWKNKFQRNQVRKPFLRDFYFWIFIDFSVTPKVFELLTFAFAHMKDKMSDWGSFVILSFYFPQFELVHRVDSDVHS